MDWKRAMEEERNALLRLVALLHALAGLAECAAGRSPAVRGLVLWLLRFAEPVAREFITGEPGTPPASTAIGTGGNGPEHAMRLAKTLRALAWQLEAQIGLLFALCDAHADRTAGKSCRHRRVPEAAGILAVFSATVSPALCASHLAHVPDTS